MVCAPFRRPPRDGTPTTWKSTTRLSVNLERVSANYPQVLRLGTTIGAWFRADENSADDPGVVISYRLWQTRFGGDPGVIGKHVRLTNDFRVAGVAPREFTGSSSPMRIDAWVPLSGSVSNHRVDLIARLEPRATLANAAAELGVIGARVRAAYPGDQLFQAPVRVQPATGFLLTGGREMLMPIVKLLRPSPGRYC